MRIAVLWRKRHRPARKIVARGALLVVSYIVGSIVLAGLDRGYAQPSPVVGVETQRVAPFNKMRAPENILVIGAAPNPALRLISQHSKPIVVSDEVSRSVGKQDHSRGEGGTVFLIIVVGGLITVFVLYQAGRN